MSNPKKDTDHLRQPLLDVGATPADGLTEVYPEGDCGHESTKRTDPEHVREEAPASADDSSSCKQFRFHDGGGGVTPVTVDSHSHAASGPRAGIDDLTEAVATARRFDPARLRLAQNFGDSVGVRKVLLTVPVRKPDRQWFVRTHPDAEYRLQTAVLELKEDGEMYLTDPVLWPEIPGDLVPMQLATAINRQGVLFLWPVRLPGEDGKVMEWHRSAAEAVEMAITRWVRVQANMSLGAYEVFEASGDLPDPVWPDKTFQELLEIAFRDRYITSTDHPVLRRLRGET